MAINVSLQEGHFDWDISMLTNAPSLSMLNSALGLEWAISKSWGGWSQATTSKQPIVRTNALNGNRVLTFDGVDDYIQASSNYVHRSIFFVYRFKNTSSITSLAKKWFFGHPTSYHYHPKADTSTAIGDSAHMHANLKHAGGIRIDGGNAFNPTSANWTNDTNFHIAVFEATGNVEAQRLGGFDRTIARYADVEIAELFGFSEPMNESDRLKMEGNSAHKYGLTSNLVSTHWYKNIKPLSKMLFWGNEAFSSVA